MKKIFTMLTLTLLFGGATILAQNVDVTFQVDMGVKIALGYFNPSTDVVTCPGGFNNWLNEPPANTEKVMADADNDSIYTITISMAPSQTYEYKFNIGLGWDGKDETHGNRSVEVGTTNMTVPISFFNDYTPYTGVTSTINFNVDMQGPAQGTFDPATNHVYVAGNFTDWGTGAIEMFDPDNDSIFTVDVPTLVSGNHAIYKFIWSTGAASSGTWESPTEGDDIFGGDHNRIYGIHDGIDTVSRFWNNTNPEVVVLVDGNILFVVDMSVANELGVFNPDADSVQIRGGFNGWNASDPPRSLMNQDPGDPNVWFLNIPMIQYELNSTGFYKYFIKNDPGSVPYSNTGWEVSIDPTTSGNRDRPVVYQGLQNQEEPYAYFEGIHTDWVVPSGTSIQATFSVDMGPATDFNPATDSVVWVPRQPFYYAVHNIPWPGDYPRVLYLTDANSDMIYEGTLTITGPDFNGFLYNYGYVDVSASNALVQEGGSQEECRVRYVAQTGARAFVNPYNFPQDVWTPTGQKPEENPPTSVEEIPGVIPNAYSLEQNYPNPFNPATLIRFSIPEQGLVSIKVFNLLGEEVATLVNGELSTGNYEVSFNGAKLSSGIYFYTITTDNFVATKKMILMK
jgi:hypothetical protein